MKCEICNDPTDEVEFVKDGEYEVTACANCIAHAYWRAGVPVEAKRDIVQDLFDASIMAEGAENICSRAANEIIDLRAQLCAVIDVTAAPEGWFLHSIQHAHTVIIHKNDTHKPKYWLVQMQKYPTGGNLTVGKGATPREAWENCIANIKKGQSI